MAQKAYDDIWSWTEWLGVTIAGMFLGVGVIGALYMILQSLGKRYGTNTVIASVCIIIVTIPISMCLWILAARWFYRVRRWYDDLFNYTPTINNYYTSGNTTNKYVVPYTPKIPIKQPKRAYLIAGERKSAPRAYMFGRLEGKPIESTGNYEDKWLNTYEYSYWLQQKEYKEAAEDRLLDENIDKPFPGVQTTTKILY